MGLLERALDQGVARVQGIFKMFADGWGDPAVINALLDEAREIGPVPEIQLNWRTGERTWRGLHSFRGWFRSPTRHLPLPPESRTAYVEMVLPREPFDSPRPGMVLQLAGTGDMTYAARRRLALPLVRRGIGTIILQNPYYGERAPANQTGTILRQVVDQLTMNLATIQEARGILDWLRREGFRHVGVTGYSMGGFMAGYTAYAMPYPVAAIPCAAGDSASDILIHSPLRRIVDWETLAREAGGLEEARFELREILDQLSLTRFDPPACPEAAIIVGTSNDAFIDVEQPRKLHQHWRGSELRWIPGSHTSGWALYGRIIRRAVRDAFTRLRTCRASNPANADANSLPE